MQALIAGGSLGGLCAALALQDAGWDVDVFERSSEDPRGRGAGIVMQPETEWFLRRVGSSAEAVSIPIERRQFLDAGGGSTSITAPQLMTSWERVYDAVRAALPDDRYHLHSGVVAVEQVDAGVEATLATGRQLAGDLLVGADGIRSTIRRELLPTIAPSYAGYLAWRGLIAEGDLDDDTVALLRDTFTFFSPPGTQFLCYFVPGDTGDLRPGRRRLNWVWYVVVPEEQLRATLGVGTGAALEDNVPPGQVGSEVRNRVRTEATARLPRVLAHVVNSTEQLFAQAIFDVQVAQMAFPHACLLGDAAFVVRPHTAAGTSKAAGDALTLAAALRGEATVEEALRGWERERLEVGRALSDRGRLLAQQSGFPASAPSPG